MTIRSVFAAVAAFCLLCGTALQADDQELSQAEIEALMMELGVPSEEHERLAEMVGTWTTEVKLIIPGAPEPIVSEGTAEFETILDGRFLVQNFEGDFAGMPFSGYGVSGYDRVQEKYTGFWTDSFSTGMMTVEGTYDEETEEMTEMGTFPTPGGEMRMKMVSHWLNDDQFHFTMYMLEGENEVKHMEITYTRADE